MSNANINAAAKTLLRKIAAGESHRAAWASYEAVTKAGLAKFSSSFEGGSGKWELTDKGRAFLGK